MNDMSWFNYTGAFNMNGLPNGGSKLNNSEAIIDVDAANNRFFITSHLDSFTCNTSDSNSNSHYLAELRIPTIVNSTNLSDLLTAEFIQDFSNILDYSNIPYSSIDNSLSTPNEDCLDRITGIKYINGSLIVNAMEYYDGNNNNIDTTLFIQDANNLATSSISGFFQVDGAAHTSRWISDIPLFWQSDLAGKHLFGNGNNYPRNGRQSLGPTAYTVDISKFVPNPTSTAISSIKLLDYKSTTIAEYYFGGTGFYKGALHEDFFNINGNNTLWTEKSKALFGFIVPNTSTYLIVGSSGGHNSRICYKNTYSKSVTYFNDGKLSAPIDACKSIRTAAEYATLTPQEQVGVQSCSGYCIVDPSDLYNYYWLYDVNDLIKVKEGSILPNEVKPYKTGIFNVPFQESINGDYEFHQIGSGSFDSKNEILYLTIRKAGTNGSFTTNNNRPPIMVAYKLNIPRQPKPPSNLIINN